MGRPEIQYYKCPLVTDKCVDILARHRKYMMHVTDQYQCISAFCWNTKKLPWWSSEPSDQYLAKESARFHRITRTSTRWKVSTSHWRILLGLPLGIPPLHIHSVPMHLGQTRNSVSCFKKEKRRLSQNDKAAKHVRFALKQLTQSVYKYIKEYFTNKTIWAKIEFREALTKKYGFIWESPIGLMTIRTPLAKIFGIRCLDAGGYFSILLWFLWYYVFPTKVVERNLIHERGNKDGLLISINVLNFVTVIINHQLLCSLYSGKRWKCHRQPFFSGVEHHGQYISSQLDVARLQNVRDWQQVGPFLYWHTHWVATGN